MANRFEPQFINPGCTADFVDEFHRRLPNYLDTEKLGLGRNGEILLDRRPGRGSFELPEDYIEAGWHLSIGNSKSNSLVCGYTFSHQDVRGQEGQGPAHCAIAERRPLVARARKAQRHGQQAQYEQVVELVTSEHAAPLEDGVGEHGSHCG